MSPRDDLVIGTGALRLPWACFDPFLFCMHHDDQYPAGNERFGPAASLAGRQMGQDFAGIDGWRMYHGSVVPGFPQHPHRGFETVTIVRQGLLDHSDSLGAAARFGEGDVQWVTAGRGILHAEMFPLLRRDAKNPVELFQIWLNLPRRNKLVEPSFSMLWSGSIPRLSRPDADGNETLVTLDAGAFGDAKAPAPPPHSWAADPRNEVAIWTIKLAPRARFELPAVSTGIARTLYFFAGDTLSLGEQEASAGSFYRLQAGPAVGLANGPQAAELLLLQGRPIGEPVAQHGPFVMNTREELYQAFDDYQRTGFGEWPWPAPDPVHGPALERFARRPDGTTERPG